MTDLQATLDAIDSLAVHECGHCDKPLTDDGPSQDFCNEACQTAWLGNKRRVEQLIGYREPVDLMYPQTATRLPSPGEVVIPDHHRAAAEAARDAISGPRYGAPTTDHPVLRPGEWRALLAAPWHPDPLTVRPSFSDRPPGALNAVRPSAPRMWNPTEPVDPFEMALTQDSYRLESFNERSRTALYRVQGLPGPRYVVFRGRDYLPEWWMRGGWEGRWMEAPPHTRGFSWPDLDRGQLLAQPTERYETRGDGAVAEVWEVRP